MARQTATGVLLAVAASGQRVFDFAYDDDFGEHVERFDPTFAKVLVRYNPEDSVSNTEQTARLRRLSDWLHARGHQFLFELLMPATIAQLTALDGKYDRYDGEQRLRLIVSTIAERQAAGGRVLVAHRGSRRRSPSEGGMGVVRTPALLVTPKNRMLIALTVTILYALCFVAIKAGLDLAPPLRFAGLRTFIAGVALLALVAIRREPVIPLRRTVPGLLILTFVATTIVYGAMFLSPGRTGAGIASVLGNAQPLFTVALASLFLGERLTSGKVVALALGGAGATLVTYPALAGPDAYGVSGALLALTVSAGAAVGNVVVKRLGPMPSLLTITAWGLLLGSLPLLGASLVVERGDSVTWNPEFLGLLLFLALPGTALATAVWYWLLQRSDVGRLAMFFFLVPVLGLALAAAIFGEQIGGYETAGIILIVVGLGSTIREIRRADNPGMEPRTLGDVAPTPRDTRRW